MKKLNSFLILLLLTVSGNMLNAQTPPDIDVIGLLSPLNVKATNTHIFKARFKNSGSIVIDSLPVVFAYSVDSGKSWTSENDTLYALKQGNTYDYTFNTKWTPKRFGEFGIEISATYNTSIGTQVKTAKYEICSGLAGVFTVGTASSRFPTMTYALNLINKCGLSGHVRLVLTKGTYSQIALGEIIGSGPNATLTFDGQHPDTATIKHTATSFEGTVDLKTTSYVTFKNLTIEHNSGVGAGVRIWEGAHHNAILSSRIIAQNPSAAGASVGLAFSGQNYQSATKCDQNLIKDNVISGQNFGIYLKGDTSRQTGNSIIGNRIENYFDDGLNLNYQRSCRIEGNSIIKPALVNAEPWLQFNCANSDIRSNTVVDFDLNGINLYNENQNSNFNSTFVNNVITGLSAQSDPNPATCLAIYKCNNIDVYHNTLIFKNKNIVLKPTINWSWRTSCVRILESKGIDFSNNIVYNTNLSKESTPVSIEKSSCEMHGNNLYQPSGLVAYIDKKTFYYNIADLSKSNLTAVSNNVSIKPNFISTSDYHLATNRVNPRTKPIGVLYDIDSNLRCTFAPSIGADESSYVQAYPASFTANDTLFVKTRYSFSSGLSALDPVGVTWLINGAKMSDSTNLNHRFTSSGRYQLKLEVETCNRTDSMSKWIWVDTAIRKPIANFSIMQTITSVGNCVKLTNTSTFGPDSFYWKVEHDSISSGKKATFCNSKASDRDVSVSFSGTGYYSVTLWAFNNIGSDYITKTRSIYVGASFRTCGNHAGILPANGSLLDDGGASGDYTANQKCSLIISACKGPTVLNIKHFDLAAGSYLRIYEGLSNLGNPLHFTDSQYLKGLSGSYFDKDFPYTFTSKSGSIYVEFESGTATSSGFDLSWKNSQHNVPNPSNPGGYISGIPDTVCVGAAITVTSNYNKSYWPMFNPPNFSGWTNTPDGGAIATFSFSKVGYDTVMVYSNSCSGLDSTGRIVFVKKAAAFSAAFSQNKQRVELNEPVQFTDQSRANGHICSQAWEWIVRPKGKKYAFGASSNQYSQNPIIHFLDTGYYDIQLKVSGGGMDDSIVKKKTIYVTDYCSVKVGQAGQMGITNFKLDTASFASNISSSGYQNFAWQKSFILHQNVFSKVEINAALGASLAAGYSVWIDLNQDGAFAKSELLAYKDFSSLNHFSDSIKIPSTAIIGKTRMRIAVQADSSSKNGCAAVQFGEYEDYSVYIISQPLNLQVHLVGSDSVLIEQCDTSWKDPGAYGTSSFSTFIPISNTISTVDISTVGLYTIVYEVVLTSGDRLSIKRLVRVAPDKTSPKLTLLGNTTMDWPVGLPFKEPGYTATDNCGGYLTADVKVTSSVDHDILGTYTLTYYVADKALNDTTLTRTVKVVDLEAPTIKLIGSDTIRINVFGTYNELGAIATDNYYSNLVYTIAGSVDSSKIGVYVLSYTTQDGSGNVSAPVKRYIVVEDNEAPKISLEYGDDTTIVVHVFERYGGELVNVSDNYTSETKLRKSLVAGGTYLTAFGNGSTYKIGTFNYTWTVTDEAGNTNSAARKIVVVDTIAPKAQLKSGLKYVEVSRWANFNPIKDVDLFLIDNYYDAPELSYKVASSDVNTQSVGQYTVKYQLEDPSKNKGYFYLTVNVINDAQAIGIGQAELNAEIYPNPTQGIVSIKMKGIDNAQYKLINAQGKELDNLAILPVGEEFIQLDLSNLSDGLYYLEIRKEGLISTQKIILMR